MALSLKKAVFAPVEQRGNAWIAIEDSTRRNTKAKGVGMLGWISHVR